MIFVRYAEENLFCELQKQEKMQEINFTVVQIIQIASSREIKMNSFRDVLKRKYLDIT